MGVNCKTLIIFLLSLLLLSVYTSVAYSQSSDNATNTNNVSIIPLAPNVEWMKSYDAPTFPEGSFIQTADGGYILVGVMDRTMSWFSVYLVRTDSNGTLLWKKELNSPTYTMASGAGLDSIQQTPDGGYIMIGSSGIPKAWEGSMYLAKLDSSGSIQWEKRYSNYDCGGNSVQMTMDGGYILAGGIDFSHAGEVTLGFYWTGYLVKVDSQGSMQWSGIIGGNNSAIFCVKQTSDGGYIVVGDKCPPNTIGNFQMYVAKVSSGGGVLWEKTIGSGVAHSVVETDDGYVVAGCTLTSETYLTKLDTMGNVIWSRNIGGSGDYNQYYKNGFHLIRTNDDGFIIVGKDSIIRTDASGEVVWVLDEPGVEGYQIRPATDGGYVILGPYFSLTKLGPERYPGILSFENSSYQVLNDIDNISVTVSRLNGTSDNVSVDYHTVNGSAIEGIDYVPANGTLYFIDGESSKTFDVYPIHRDGYNQSEYNVTFSILLSNATGGASVGNIDKANFTLSYFNDSPLKNDTTQEPVSSDDDVGNTTSIFNVNIGKTASVAGVAALGTLLGLISMFLDKLLGFLFDGVKSYFQRRFSVWESRVRKVVAEVRKPLVLGVSFTELVIGFNCAIIIGLVFAYKEDILSIPSAVVYMIIAAGLTAVVHEIAHKVLALKYKTETEYKFWGVGTLTLIATTLLNQPFSQPARTIINKADSMNSKDIGIVSLSGPAVSLLLSILFLLVFYYGQGFSDLGKYGFSISMLACVYSLMPFKPMEGQRVYAWNKWLWALVFIPSLILYLAILIQVFK